MAKRPFRWILVALAAVTVVAGAACTPVKAPPVPGRNISTYYAADGTLPASPYPTNLYVSSVPTRRTNFAGTGTMTQRLEGNKVLLENVQAPALTGFGLVPLRLGDIQSARVFNEATGDAMQIFMIFDKNNDGQFLPTDANGKVTGLGGDDIGFDGSTFGPTLFVNDTRRFTLVSGAGTHTVAALKAGAVPGIDANTRVILGVQIAGASDTAFLISSFQVNDVEFL